MNGCGLMRLMHRRRVEPSVPVSLKELDQVSDTLDQLRYCCEHPDIPQGFVDSMLRNVDNVRRSFESHRDVTNSHKCSSEKHLKSAEIA
jgi:hypothetical protein